MHKAGLDNGHTYGLDLCVGEIKASDETDRANDLRAIINAVVQNRSVGEIQREIITVASVDRLTERAGMIKRGIEEVTIFLNEKGNEQCGAPSALIKGYDRCSLPPGSILSTYPNCGQSKPFAGLDSNGHESAFGFRESWPSCGSV